MSANCACTAHMQTHFTTLCWWWLRSRCLWSQSDIWRLTTARRNSYQPVLVHIYSNCAIVEAWLLSWCVKYVSSEHYCQAEVFCSWYMQIVQVYSPDKICIVLCYHPYLVSCCSVIPTSRKYKLLVPSWSSYCFSQHTHPHSCKPVIGLILPAIKPTGYLYHCSQTYSIQIKMNLFIQFVQPPFSWI